MTIDASTAYLPEQTWFVNGLYHGMTWRDPYAKSLCCMLITSQELVDVHTYAEYPQFKYADNNSYSVLSAFDSSKEGYLSSDDQAIRITNLSQKYPMRVISISCDGADLDFNVTKLTYIPVGKTKEIRFKGEVPAKSLTTVDVTVTYSLIGNVTPVGTRTFTYTLLNGEAPAYDESQPFTAALHTTYFEDHVSDTSKKILSKTGWFDFLKMVINAMVAICNMFKAYCRIG